MISFVVEAIRERCASFMILTTTEICGGQINVSILVVYIYIHACVYAFVFVHCIAFCSSATEALINK